MRRRLLCGGAAQPARLRARFLSAPYQQCYASDMPRSKINQLIAASRSDIHPMIAECRLDIKLSEAVIRSKLRCLVRNNSIDSSVAFGDTAIDRSVSSGDKAIERNGPFEAKLINSSVPVEINPLIGVAPLGLKPLLAVSV